MFNKLTSLVLKKLKYDSFFKFQIIKIIEMNPFLNYEICVEMNPFSNYEICVYV